MGLFTFYGADSDMKVTSPDTGEILIDADLETEMIGRFGLGGGYQRFIRDDFALHVGVEGRYTEPVVNNPPQTAGGLDVFTPGDVVQFQASIGGRWWLPTRWTAQGRLRPFVGIDLSFVPETNFDVLAQLNDDLAIPFEFTGSSYWTIGPCVGLSYQWEDDLVVHLTVFYEKALSVSEDLVFLAIPGVDPDFVPPFPTTTTVDAAGVIGFLSVSWGF